MEQLTAGKPDQEQGGHETVALKVGADQLPAFFPLLQRGVTVQAVVGCSLRDLLTRQFCIPADYVTGRITTIFLDNKPLDDLDSTVRAGARLTLSAAMPGLVGAVMRRSGFYAALRQGITHVGKSNGSEEATATLTLKLFNLLLEELGPLVLSRGIMLQRKEVNELLRRLSTLWIASSYPCRDEAAGTVLLKVEFGD